MTHEQFEKAANYWENKEYTVMPKRELEKAIEALKKLESSMNLICVTSVKIEMLCSEFKKNGYSSRQTLEY